MNYSNITQQRCPMNPGMTIQSSEKVYDRIEKKDRIDRDSRCIEGSRTYLTVVQSNIVLKHGHMDENNIPRSIRRPVHDVQDDQSVPTKRIRKRKQN